VKILKDTKIQNPKELAHHVLGKVLEITGEVPTDDMTIIAAGIWKR
jgi:stage II sporulation protein E